MSAPVSKCDVIRDFIAASNCGLCTGGPSNCPPGLTKALCGIPQAANNRMYLFADKYNPSNLFMGSADLAQLRQEEMNYASGIQAVEQGIQASYPGLGAGGAAISWPDFNACLWNKNGKPGGPNSNIYFGRDDVQELGMSPAYPIGGTLAQGYIWPPPRVSPFPATVDYISNPDFIAIFMFVFLVILLAVLVYTTYRAKKMAPILEDRRRQQERQRLEATDPYRGSAFESYPDPAAKCRAYVEAMEARGFAMNAYRQACGLPLMP